MKYNFAISMLLAAAIFFISACHTSIPNDAGEPTGALSVTDAVTEEESLPILKPFPHAGELQSRAIYVIDMDTGGVQFAMNEKLRMNPASTIKIMTALLTLDVIGEGEGLDELVKVPSLVWATFDNWEDPNTIGGSMAGIRSGQTTLTYRDALYGLMLASGNEAANVLAYNVGGESIETFIGMMNMKAVELGCVNTRFSNAHGLLEPNNWSCAYDLALITAYAWEKYPLFREISGAQEYRMPANSSNSDGYRIGNSNAVVRRPMPGGSNIYYRGYIQGVKTGGLDEIFIRDSGGQWVEYDGIANLVSIGEQDGRTYMIVTIEAPYKYGDLNLADGTRMSRLHYAYADHILLYDWLWEGDFA